MTINSQSYKALVSGWSWGGYDVASTPRTVTFSFPKEMPAWQGGMYDSDTFSAMSKSQMGVIRKALDTWEKAAGINFVEAKGDHGDIVFGNYDFEAMGKSSGTQAFAFYPYEVGYDVKGPASDFLDIAGDVFFRDDLSASSLMPIALHEIGHAIGLKHTFDTTPGHSETLSYQDDHKGNSVMSYSGEYSSHLGKLDLIAAKSLYGAASTHGTGAASAKWSAAKEVFTQTGDDRAETIRGINLRDVVNAGDGKDKVFTFAGDDLINGGRGNDKIWTGTGSDSVLMTNGSGSDAIFDFDTDHDLLRIKVNGVTDHDDLIYRQKGDDLIIKWQDGVGFGTVKLVDVHQEWFEHDNVLFA